MNTTSAPGVLEQASAFIIQKNLMLHLPTQEVIITRDGDFQMGALSLAGLNTNINQWFGSDVSALVLPKSTVDAIMATNVQHFQFINSPEGMVILVNGQELPGMTWDGTSLHLSIEAMDKIGPSVTVLQTVLPLVRLVGIQIIVRLPIADGTAEIPLLDTDSEAVARIIKAQDEFLLRVQSTFSDTLVINYALDGTWQVAEGAPPATTLQVASKFPNLPPPVIQAIGAIGVSEIGFNKNRNGALLVINGQRLPYITWGDDRVGELLHLAVRYGLLSTLDPNEVEAEQLDILGNLIETLLPAAQESPVNLMVRFP